MVIFRPFGQYKFKITMEFRKNDKSQSIMQNMTCMKQNSTKEANTNKAKTQNQSTETHAKIKQKKHHFQREHQINL